MKMTRLQDFLPSARRGVRSVRLFCYTGTDCFNFVSGVHSFLADEGREGTGSTCSSARSPRIRNGTVALSPEDGVVYVHSDGGGGGRVQRPGRVVGSLARAAECVPPRRGGRRR